MLLCLAEIAAKFLVISEMLTNKKCLLCWTKLNSKFKETVLLLGIYAFFSLQSYWHGADGDLIIYLTCKLSHVSWL